MTALVVAISAPEPTNPNVFIQNGKAVTTSLAVAEYFHKRHDDVLKKLRSLDCSPEFTARNFAASEYTDSTGRKLPMYEMTKDGFVFLVMGFTGKKAAVFKEAYIAEFNRMEAELYTPTAKPFVPQRFLLTLLDGQWHCEVVPDDSFVATPDTLAKRIESELHAFTQPQLTRLMFICVKHINIDGIAD